MRRKGSASAAQARTMDTSCFTFDATELVFLSEGPSPSFTIDVHKLHPCSGQGKHAEEKLTRCRRQPQTQVHHSVGECVSATGPQDTVDGSAQSTSPCEVDSSESLLDGRMEGRAGVHVESEVVLKCEGNNNERACGMPC